MVKSFLLDNVLSHEVAAYLLRNGVKVVKVSPISHNDDGNIIVTDSLHVQVGRNYAIVKREKPKGTITLGKLRYDAKDILEDIRLVLMEEVDHNSETRNIEDR